MRLPIWLSILALVLLSMSVGRLGAQQPFRSFNRLTPLQNTYGITLRSCGLSHPRLELRGIRASHSSCPCIALQSRLVD